MFFTQHRLLATLNKFSILRLFPGKHAVDPATATGRNAKPRYEVHLYIVNSYCFPLDPSCKLFWEKMTWRVRTLQVIAGSNACLVVFQLHLSFHHSSNSFQMPSVGLHYTFLHSSIINTCSVVRDIAHPKPYEFFSQHFLFSFLMQPGN